jgi:single-strand DNA-binding protein
MASLNRVQLIGNLTRDPESKKVPSGTSFAVLGLAVTEKFKDREGELKERVCFLDIVVWDRQADTCLEYLEKGAPVFVEGRLQLDQWENDKGEKRSKLKVRADRVQFLNPAPAGRSDKERGNERSDSRDSGGSGRRGDKRDSNRRSSGSQREYQDR